MIVVCITALAAVLLYYGQSRLLYPAPQIILPPHLPIGAEKVALDAGYGLFIAAKNANPTNGPVIIFTHGNGEAAFQWLPAFEPLQQAGISIFLVEYPGYVGATGTPSLASIKKTVISAYDYVITLPQIDPNQVVAYGRSIGGGAATLLANSRPVAALCLESTFSSLATLVSEKGLPNFLLKDRYDNESVIRTLEISVFLYHGKNDALIPISHSQKLNAAASNATLLTASCGHNDCPRPWGELLIFLTENVTKTAELPRSHDG